MILLLLFIYFLFAVFWSVGFFLITLSPAHLKKFSISYLVDRYSRSGFQSQGLLWSGQGVQLTHNALHLLSIWDPLTAETVLLSSICEPMASLSASSASSFQRSSRYSTSTVRSFNADSLHPRLHSQFGEETSISSITNRFEPESFSRCHGDAQDESSWGESFGGYQGNQLFNRLPQRSRVFYGLPR